MKLRFTAAARRELLAIGDWIARDSPRRASAFVEILKDRCRNITDSPEAFPLVPGYEQDGVRRRTFGNYLILYRVDAGTVIVLHVAHGARDLDAVLLDPDAS